MRTIFSDARSEFLRSSASRVAEKRTQVAADSRVSERPPSDCTAANHATPGLFVVVDSYPRSDSSLLPEPTHVAELLWCRCDC